MRIFKKRKTSNENEVNQTAEENTEPQEPENPVFKVEQTSTSYHHTPPLLLIDTENPENTVRIFGPKEDTIQSPEAGVFEKSVCGKTISTYPHVEGEPNRFGDPICDRYFSQIYENRIIAGVCDGCGWGPKPRNAAVDAGTQFLDYIVEHQHKAKTVKEVGELLLNALEASHYAILEGHKEFYGYDCGTTTLLGGILLEVDKGSDKWQPPFMFVCVSIGDCKAFSYESATGRIEDITASNRQNAADASDCGGRLGPYKNGLPDLRNLNLFASSVDVGDIIIIVSDGVHDNLDPQQLGKLPKDLSKEYNLVNDTNQDLTWKQVDPQKANIAKDNFRNTFLQSLFEQANSDCEFVSNALVKHGWQVTQKSRDFMENNEGKRVPDNYEIWPGKMDHTTCLSFLVGKNQSIKISQHVQQNQKEEETQNTQNQQTVQIQNDSDNQNNDSDNQNNDSDNQNIQNNDQNILQNPKNIENIDDQNNNNEKNGKNEINIQNNVNVDSLENQNQQLNNNNQDINNNIDNNNTNNNNNEDENTVAGRTISLSSSSPALMQAINIDSVPQSAPQSAPQSDPQSSSTTNSHKLELSGSFSRLHVSGSDIGKKDISQLEPLDIPKHVSKLDLPQQESTPPKIGGSWKVGRY